MTTKSILTVAAVLAAGITLVTPAAEAGGGVRLGFGGPLGSFVARPTQGYYTPSYSQRSYGSPSCDKPKYGAVRTYARPAPKKPVAVASRHDDDDDDKPSKARKTTVKTAEKTEKTSKSETIKQVASNAIPLEATATSKPASTTAPASTDLKAAAKIENSAVTPPATVSTTKVESAALVPANATIADVTPEPKVEPKAEPKVEAKETKKSDKKVEKKSDCRRFVPSAGITITVRCND